MIDPGVEIMRRLERLERQGAHLRGPLGLVVFEFGPMTQLLTDDGDPLQADDGKQLFVEAG